MQNVQKLHKILFYVQRSICLLLTGNDTSQPSKRKRRNDSSELETADDDNEAHDTQSATASSDGALLTYLILPQLYLGRW